MNTDKPCCSRCKSFRPPPPQSPGDRIIAQGVCRRTAVRESIGPCDICSWFTDMDNKPWNGIVRAPEYLASEPTKTVYHSPRQKS